jgi:hypothetical protein
MRKGENWSDFGNLEILSEKLVREVAAMDSDGVDVLYNELRFSDDPAARVQYLACSAAQEYVDRSEAVPQHVRAAIEAANDWAAASMQVISATAGDIPVEQESWAAAENGEMKSEAYSDVKHAEALRINISTPGDLPLQEWSGPDYIADPTVIRDAMVERKRSIEAQISSLESSIRQLGTALAARRLMFWRKLETWWGVAVAPDAVPFTIPEDRRAGRQYRGSGLACVGIEGLAAAWIFSRLQLPLWYGALVAVLSAALLHGATLLVFRAVERPKEELGRIRDYLLKPALYVFAASFVILLLARTAQGELAVYLLPVVGVSLWTLTIGLVTLAGALFASAHIVTWSSHDEQEYRELTSELDKTNKFRDELVDELVEIVTALPLQLPTGAQSTQSNPASGPGPTPGAIPTRPTIEWS